MSKDLERRVRRENVEMKARKQKLSEFERPSEQPSDSRLAKNIEREAENLKHRKAAGRIFSHR